MIKKLLLFVAAVFCAVSAFATTGMGDSLPYPKYLQNLKYDKQSKQLTFEDTFYPNVQYDRLYVVYLYYRTNNSEFYKQEFSPMYYTDTVSYNYGKPVSHYEHVSGQIEVVRTYNFNHKGGQVTIDNLSDAISTCYKKGYTDIRICVQGMYNDELSNAWASYEVTSGVVRSGLHNYINVNLPLNDISLTTPEYVNYGQQMVINGHIQGTGKLTWKIQESDSADEWKTVHSGTLSSVEAREGKTVQYKRVFTGNGVPAGRFYRLVTTDVISGNIYKTPMLANFVFYRYMFVYNGSTSYLAAGDMITFPKPSDCMEYEIFSNIAIVPVEYNSSYDFLKQPACNLWINTKAKTYTVRFLNSDGTLLKSEQVQCGDDATAPDAPSLNGMKFKKWSRDFTNVHSNLSVYATYALQGDDYRFDVKQTIHTNSVNPMFDGHTTAFKKSENRAMVGDSLTFAAFLRFPQTATLYYQTAQYKDSEGNWMWEQPTNNQVGIYKTPNSNTTIIKTVPVAYTSNYYESPFVPGFAFRFYVVCKDEKLYSDPFEYDVYYALTIKSKIEGSDLEKSLMAWNTANDINMGESELVIPARYNDTVRISQLTGSKGACLTFARINQPSRDLTNGIDENGVAYFICPGEKETIEVGIAQKLIVFDGVYGGDYPKSFDFTAEGFGKINNGYYAQIANCGGRVLPEDPTMDGYIFKGWEAWNTDYADTAYLNIPAISDNVIGFTAKFEELPTAPQYTVNFYGVDGMQIGGPKRLAAATDPLLDTQQVEEGLNATPPDVPYINGYHFNGWDKDFTTITGNTDIYAVYGQDTKTWTVTYKNYDGSDLGTELVEDGQAANGVIATRTNWTFVKWRDYYSGEDVDLEHITADITVEAVFTEVLYTVTYRVDGVTTYSIQAVVGYDASAIYYPYGTPVKEANDSIVFTFERWSSELGETVTHDMTLDAVFSESARQYTVIFNNWDRTEVQTQQVAYGKSAIVPATVPVREGYTFIGWDRDFSIVLSDLVITAVFQRDEEEQGIPTAVEELEVGAGIGSRKLLHDGILYIQHNGKTYNILGSEVK